MASPKWMRALVYIDVTVTRPTEIYSLKSIPKLYSINELLVITNILGYLVRRSSTVGIDILYID